jgi:hypothetical protein
MKNGMRDMNRIEIQERVKELLELRARWINENSVPVEQWNDSPFSAEFEMLAELMHECWFGQCECTELQHELSTWSELNVSVFEAKNAGNFEGLVEKQRLRASQVKDVNMRMRMLSELRWLRAGAVNIDKPVLLTWKRKAEGGDGKFAKILKRRDASLAAKHRERMRGGVILV